MAHTSSYPLTRPFIAVWMPWTRQSVWNMLRSAAQSGSVRGLVLGPPCETWSSPRHEELANATGPRPVRTSQFPWGRCDITLTLQEVRQVGIGSVLLLRGLWLGIMVAITGGSLILEHPSEPRQEDRASIWRTALMRILLRYMKVFSRNDIEQWRYGAGGIKPTTFLVANCDLEPWLRLNEDLTRVRPSVSLIGKMLMETTRRLWRKSTLLASADLSPRPSLHDTFCQPSGEAKCCPTTSRPVGACK